jgi:hypothetical protein
VSRGDRGWQLEVNRQSAEDALSDHRAERGPSHQLHPRATFNALRPDGDDDCEESDELGDHAVAVFKEDSTLERWNAIEGSERRRPIGHGEASIIAGDECASDEQQERAASREQHETVVCAIESRGLSLRTRLPGMVWSVPMSYERDHPDASTRELLILAVQAGDEGDSGEVAEI